MGNFPDLVGGYVPTVGDEIVLSGRVSEFFSLTELSGARLVEKLSPVPLDVDAVTPAFEAAPPNDLAEANRYWERREGMRGRVPARARPTRSSGSSVATIRSQTGRTGSQGASSAIRTRSTTCPHRSSTTATATGS
jgi:hypothetical protein